MITERPQLHDHQVLCLHHSADTPTHLCARTPRWQFVKRSGLDARVGSSVSRNERT